MNLAGVLKFMVSAVRKKMKIDFPLVYKHLDLYSTKLWKYLLITLLTSSANAQLARFYTKLPKV
jgi:hypothetical protein